MLKKYFRKIRLPLVIAEIGLNHNGDVNLAKKYGWKYKTKLNDAILITYKDYVCSINN